MIAPSTCYVEQGLVVVAQDLLIANVRLDDIIGGYEAYVHKQLLCLQGPVMIKKISIGFFAVRLGVLFGYGTMLQ